jgi:hypothetical protein
LAQCKTRSRQQKSGGSWLEAKVMARTLFVLLALSVLSHTAAVGGTAAAAAAEPKAINVG